MLIEGEFGVPLARAPLYERLLDTRLMAACIPGCESLEQLDAQRYRAVVAVGLGAVRARFDVVVEVTHAVPGEAVHSIARGDEGGRASTLTATNVVTLRDDGEAGTRVSYRSDVVLAGRMGKFALGVMRKKAQSLGEEFARNLEGRLREATDAAAAEPLAPTHADAGFDADTATSIVQPSAEPHTAHAETQGTASTRDGR